MVQFSGAILEDHTNAYTELGSGFYHKIKVVLAELIDLKVDAVETFAICIEQEMPSEWKSSELGQFLYDLKNRYLILLKPNYQAKENHRLQVYESLQRILITLNDILKIEGHEEKLFQNFKQEINIEIQTLDSLRMRCTYTGGDQNLGYLLDQIELTAQRYEGSLEREKQKESHHDELHHIKKIIAASQHSIYSDWQQLQDKLEDANERESFLHRRCSQISQRYSTILENLISNLIEYKINPSSGLSKELQSLIDDGLLSSDLLRLCGKPDTLDLSEWVEGLSKQSPKVRQQNLHFTRMSDWLSIELQNSLETPFRKAVYQTLIFYHQLMRRLLSNLEFQEVHLHEDLIQFNNCTKLRNELTTLRKITFFTTAYEHALEKGRSVSSAQRVREYTKLSVLSKTKQIELQHQFDLLGWGNSFKKYMTTLQNNLKQLMVVKHQIKALLIKVERYLEKKLPALQHRAADQYEHQSISYRLQQLLLEVKHSAEVKGTETTFLPILNPGEANVSLNILADGISNLEKYFPIFKRPLGSLKDPDPQPISLDKWLIENTDLPLEKKLVELEDQLRNYQLKSRETRVLILPSEGQGSYDPFTNTLIIPQVSQQENLLGGLYKAISTYLYRSRIQNNTLAYNELVEILGKRHKNIKKRQHCERIIVNAFCKHLMEVTGLIHTSGHTEKEKKMISSHLDHPNHLIQCREIINIQMKQREVFLDSIMDKLGITKCLHIGEQIIQKFEDPELSEINTEIPQNERLISIFEDFDSDTRLQLIENLFDLGVIEFHKHHLHSSLECFLILTHINPESQEVWWNVATILNYHPFDGYVELVKDRKKTAIEAYRKFSQISGVSEYWIKKSRALSQELEHKQI
jgi:sRNA-binding regulator protein Hfq